MFSIEDFLSELYRREIGIIMVEGGGKTLTWFFENRKVDELFIFIGNKLLGGEKSISAIGGNSYSNVEKCVYLEDREIEFFDNDILIKGKPCFQE